MCVSMHAQVTVSLVDMHEQVVDKIAVQRPCKIIVQIENCGAIRDVVFTCPDRCRQLSNQRLLL
jgi:hypothetical protein